MIVGVTQNAVRASRSAAEEVTQATDQVDVIVGEHAAIGASIGDLGRIGMIATQEIAKPRTRKPFHLGIFGGDRRNRRRQRGFIKGVGEEIRSHAKTAVLEGGPVETGHGLHLVRATAADEDIVAALADHFIEATVAEEDVMTDDRVGAEGVEVVARGTILAADFDPVVTFVTGHLHVETAAEDEIIAFAGNHLGDVLAGDDKVVTTTGEDQVDAVAAVDHVVAVATLEHIVAADIGDDVVAVAALDVVVTETTFEAVVAAIAIQGVVADAGDEDVIVIGATEHHVFIAGVLQVVGVYARGCRVVANHQRHQRVIADRVGLELQGRIDFEDKPRGEEHYGRQVGRVGVVHHHLGERVVLQFTKEVETKGSVQVVEAIAVLQGLELGFEDEVEGRTEHAAERHLLLGETTDPQVDIVETGDGHTVRAASPCPGTVEEVKTICWRAEATQNNGRGRCALTIQGVDAGDTAVGTVSRNEVDQGFRMLDVLHEIGPTGVRPQLVVAGTGEELPAGGVQGRNARVTAASDVDRSQVERQADQVVAQGLCDELVDLVTNLTGHTTDDGAGSFVRGRAAGSELQRIEEGRDQADLLVAHLGRVRVANDVEVDVEAVDGFQQHRVAEAVNGMGKLGNDRWVDGVIEIQEGVDLWLNGARELFEHDVLILHLGAELGGLEQAFAIPVEGRGIGGNRSDRGQQPLIEERQVTGVDDHILGDLDQPVVFGVEDVVHGRQADVLVDPAVAGDVVGIKQFVVVGACNHRPTSNSVGIGGKQIAVLIHRHGVVRDIDEELVTGTQGIIQADTEPAIGCRVALDQHIALHDHLREAVDALDEVAIGIGGEQRHVVEVGIGQIDPEDVARLRLDYRPSGHAAKLYIVQSTELTIRPQIAVGDQPPGRYRCTGTIELIGTQEHLVRRVRAVSLVLVDERRSGVFVLVNIIGSA
ncbi:hypothetical protein D3C84_312800 [compost metagenome]